MAQLLSAYSAKRRARFIELLIRERLDAGVITDVHDIYYFTGTIIPADLPALLALRTDGTSLVICPAEFEVGSVDRALHYQWNHRGTRNPSVIGIMLEVLADAWRPAARHRIGVQSNSLLECVSQILEHTGTNDFLPIDAELEQMQRRKDPDEIDVIRASIAANLAAYDAVAAEIRPGANELDVLAAGRRGATSAAGEKVFHDGDYQCGQFNGPARDRRIEAGELYIVDAWTCYRGYWSDLSRTYAVGAEPTEIQQALFDHIQWIHSKLPELLRPDTDGMDVYSALDEMIRLHPPLRDTGLIHHGGHAIGLRIHEMPDINLSRGGKLEAGNVICVEPGGYVAAARYGVRLENTYLITEFVCENLCPGELQLMVCN
jgi:Xaa-Pro aminopeptidase